MTTTPELTPEQQADKDKLDLVAYGKKLLGYAQADGLDCGAFIGLLKIGQSVAEIVRAIVGLQQLLLSRSILFEPTPEHLRVYFPDLSLSSDLDDGPP